MYIQLTCLISRVHEILFSNTQCICIVSYISGSGIFWNIDCFIHSSYVNIVVCSQCSADVCSWLVCCCCIVECSVCVVQLLIAFETGQLVVWDLKTRTAECRYQSAEPLRSVSWHYEGKQFMCSHTDGSLTTWTVKQPSPKPTSTIFPHGQWIISSGSAIISFQCVLDEIYCFIYHHRLILHLFQC